MRFHRWVRPGRTTLRRAAVAVAVAAATWAGAQDTFSIGLDQSRAGVIPKDETRHLYLVDVPAGTPYLSIGVDAFGVDADLAVYVGSERSELFFDASLDPYPSFTQAAPAPGRYEIHVLNLLWQDLAYELHVTSTAAIAGFPPVDRPRPPATGTPGGSPPPLPAPGAPDPAPPATAATCRPALLVDVAATTPGAPVVVSITDAPGDRDWVGLYRVAADEREHLTWQWTGGGAHGTLTFTAPTETGAYEFRLFDRGAYGRLATSPAFVVRGAAGPAEPVVPPPAATPPPPASPPPPVPPTAPTLSTTTPVVVPGGEVVAVFSGTPGGARDWVGLYRAGAEDRQWLGYLYTAAVTDGRLTFAAPAEPGAYEFRLFANDGYTRLAVGGAFEVRAAGVGSPSAPVLSLDRGGVAPGEPIVVTFAGAPASRDWIGLYRVGADDRQFVTWQPTGDVEQGSLKFTAPNEAGSYEFRLYDEWAYDRIAVSPTFDVR